MVPAITASSWTRRCGPFGPSTSRDWISPLRYQDRRAERETPVSASAVVGVTQGV